MDRQDYQKAFTYLIYKKNLPENVLPEKNCLKYRQEYQKAFTYLTKKLKLQKKFA